MVLHLVPRYRQRLLWPPIENRPVWVDDRDFNLDRHIRHTALPHPGSEEDLKRLSARVMVQELYRARPLWEMWVIEGLQGLAADDDVSEVGLAHEVQKFVVLRAVQRDLCDEFDGVAVRLLPFGEGAQQFFELQHRVTGRSARRRAPTRRRRGHKRGHNGEKGTVAQFVEVG